MAQITMAAARVNKQLSQEQMADRMGISRVYYSELENGKREVKPIHLFAFCYITGFSVDDIILPTKST